MEWSQVLSTWENWQPKISVITEELKARIAAGNKVYFALQRLNLKQQADLQK